MTGHPARYSPEVLAVFEAVIVWRTHVHDPFAGTGERLGALCDRIGAFFTGTDIEDWPGHDPRVTVADARDPRPYPAGPFVVATSPVYANKRLADYRNGPVPTTKVKGRRDYGISLGRSLHPDNLARTTGRPSQTEAYWSGHSEAVKHWSGTVLVNVDEPISDRWQDLLRDHGYRINQVIPVFTRRYRGLANAGIRADHEVVISASLIPSSLLAS